MPPIRLVGLFLFITSIFLGLMAAATKTSHIDVKRRDRVVAAERARQANLDPEGQQPLAPELQFVSVPIVYPLTLLGVLGLLLWFIPATFSHREKPTKRRTSRRRKSNVSRKKSWVKST